MAFEPGTRLGPYELLSQIGAGGMGQVHRARDTRLDRIVAIKVLTGALAADGQARQRFEEEARAIAALNDPHICTIHDVGREGDLDYLVFEYLEGETLAERLKRAPSLSLAETLAIAIQMADALDRAHRVGIAHRDIKPGNVMLVRRATPSTTPDVKLLDFGLASRMTTARPKGVDPSLSETVAATMVATRPPTATNVASGISGTFPYMAPEQLEGQESDHRADIFAFGCVLYEMLARRKAFDSGSPLTVIAAIMTSEPPPIPSLDYAHPLLDHVMRCCLVKDRDHRWQSIADVATQLRWIAKQPPPSLAAAPVAAPGWSRRRRAVVSATAVVLAAALGAAIVAMVRGQTAPPSVPSLRLEITTPPTDDPSAALSPDGTQIAFVAHKDGVPVLWVRALDGIDNRALPGTEGAGFPFWSPDGRTIGFFADNKLKRIDADGGTPLVITDAPTGRGADWGPDGTILFAPGVSAPIMRVSARGGRAERVTDNSGPAGPSHRFPQFLPDGKRFIFSSGLGTADTNGVYIGSFDGQPAVRLAADDGTARFAAPDKLLTIGNGALQVYSFDPSAGTVHGEPAIMTQGFGDAGINAIFGTSNTGILAYRRGAAQQRHLVWVNRQGMTLGTVAETQATSIASPELSPDERTVAVFLHPEKGSDNDVWVIELGRNLARPITSGPPADAHPVWDPDGQHLVFNSGGAVRKALSGGRAEPLFSKPIKGMALAWTNDRRFVLVARNDPKSATDLIAISTDSAQTEIPVAQSPADEREGQFSPDGKWVAIVSNESGRPEIFLQSFPDARVRTQVSNAGGTQVRWSPDGREIFYIAPDGKLMSVAVSLGGAAPEVKLPVALFQTRLASGINVIGNKPQYAVSRDGRFLIDEAVESPSAPIVVAVNWMKKLAGR